MSPDGFAALLPVRSGSRVEDVIAELNDRPSPFARLEETHFARLVVVRLRSRRGEPLYEGAPPFLFFAAEFDGSAAAYLERVARVLAADADRAFGGCAGFPGTVDPGAFVAWLQRHRIPARFSIVGNPGAGVADVARAGALREQVSAFALRVRALAPEAFRRAWEAEWGS